MGLEKQKKSSRYYMNKYLRKDLFPSMFCPGCGNINVLNYTIRAIDNLNLEANKIVYVSGIGCSSRLTAYIDADALHTVHGRAIAFATGIKVTNPELTVIVFTGDGDLGAIGMNHFMHAIRRNIDITVICINNENYGMTGGQVSPTTPMFEVTKTTPFGNIEHSFNLAGIAKIAGASYVARWTVAHSLQAIKAIENGIKKKGFAFIEMISSCPIGKGGKYKSPREILNHYLKDSIQFDESKICDLHSERYYNGIEDPFITSSTSDKIIVGNFADLERPTYNDLYAKLKEEAKLEFLRSKNKINE
ncbi:MAG: thiamine pyrophosphate-dependent enzyme [Candidatus Helarchaeota archaeon]